VSLHADKSVATTFSLLSEMFGMVKRKKTVPNFPGDPEFMEPLDFGDPLLGRFPILGIPIPANADEIRARLFDSIAFCRLDFASIRESDLPQSVISFLIQAGITSIEKLLMTTPDDLLRLMPADTNPGPDGIEEIQKQIRDMLGLWRFEDLVDEQ
jgi:hypothetical protein